MSLTMTILGFRSPLDGNFLGTLWMLESCLFVGKKVLEQVLITFVRRMAYGKSLNLLVIVPFFASRLSVT